MLQIEEGAILLSRRKLLFAAPLSFAATAWMWPAQTQNSPHRSHFRSVEVGSSVVIEIPAHWTIRGDAELRNVEAASEATLESLGMRNAVYRTSLAVTSVPASLGSVITVAYISVSEPLSQAEFRELLTEDRAGTMAALSAAFNSQKFAEVMRSQGKQFMGADPLDVERLGGALAVRYSYSYVFSGDARVVRNTQYHIFNGQQKILISMLMREPNQPVLGPILDRIKRSIQIRERF